ncbi:MAG: GGDEF domain-containing protein [Sulfurimonas sp.]|nr:GGDEF domain-containing protein [Sulfurimonas sp.]
MADINIQDRIDFDLYVKVSEGLLKSSLALFLNIIVMIVAFYSLHDKIFLFSWLFLVFFLLVLRALDVSKYLKNPDLSSIHQHIKRFQLYSLFIALTVSCGIITLSPSHLPFHQAFLAMIVAGLSAGAVMALSYYQNLVRMYLIILIFPFAFMMLFQGTTIHLLISFLMFLFLVMLMLFSNKFYESMVELIAAKNEADIQAHYDLITGLANRLTLYDRLSMQLKRIRRDKSFAAVLFIDIDDFKLVNDTYGHHFGDMLLKEFAQRISTIVRDEDTFARLSGDEFVILIADIQGDREKSIKVAQQVAHKIHTALQSPFKIKTHNIIVNVSIGIDIIDENVKHSDHILNNADTAMYRSKKSGKNKTTLFL